jgi:3-hydroxybutyryl-CoA dehydrogenase
VTAAIPETIGVIGAGTMGAGIAQLAAQAGARTFLHDPVAEALERGIETIVTGLARSVQRGRLAASEASAIRGRVEPVAELEALAPCGIVIEAAPERLELKLELYRALAAVVDERCVLATNTSSLSVTEIAAHVPRPERVVGLHFFNPAPVMRLVEVVAGELSAEEPLAVAREVGEAMGKRVIDAADVAGFLVNRCNRPFSLESLRLLGERVASVEQIDRIARLGGGFRMGPFELMDLVGIETNHAVAESFHRASYGEPRYQPSPLQARMVAAGRLGRKSGAGWYDYAQGATDYRPPDPEPLAPGGGDGRVVELLGELPVAERLREAARAAGFTVSANAGGKAWLSLDCGPARAAPAGGASSPRARLLSDGSLVVSDPEAVGFHLVAPLGRLVELTRTPLSAAPALERAGEFFAAIGMLTELVGDAPGLVLGRIVAQLVNEAAFLIGEGNGTAEDVDAGMELGLNHPRGPVAWSRALGIDHVVAILDALHRERGEPRYRVAPLLRRLHALGAPALDAA